MFFIQRYFIIYLLINISSIFGVDKNNFKACEQSSFCRRLRNIKAGKNNYHLNLESLHVSDHSIESDLLNNDNIKFKLTVTALAGNIFRVFIDEDKPLYPRYVVQGVLDGEPQVAKIELLERDQEKVVIKSNDNKAVIFAYPFKIEFYKDEILVAIVNNRGLFEFEHLRKKTDESENIDNNNEVKKQEDPGTWEENFKSHHDSKPRGPEAVGMDVSFPDALRIYGLPEHADRLALRTTGPGGLDPYRLYNLDVFEYDVGSTMAIYGAVPVVYAHSLKNTVGLFWLNSAETWVDINNSKDANVVSSIVNLVSGNSKDYGVDTHFMSESGVVDFFILMGPTPKDAIKQYSLLTGVAPLPQYFTLGYHQCRWNYNDEDDVINVIDNFDKFNLPVDVIWLDIEYTDGKKYFTWDSIKFPNPDIMIKNLTSIGRKLVVIIDPHIKRESGYFLHEDALSNDLYVKTKEGKVYEGWCWPGSSSYLDLFDPKVQDYYKKLYSTNNFKGTNSDVFIWNDMNEPSVFNGPEITMPKDCLHYGGWEHRHVHNLYGLYYTMITYEGLLMRANNRRPFILTRAHFAGSQRYAAVWTGDNAAEWSHLQISIPMCLAEAIGGISFCGADIGGFFNNPNVELLQRWYQAGVWLPFYRAHAHLDTRRREPYLFDEDVRFRIANALKLRYTLLPLWYTLFREHEITGEPVIRPLFYHYPDDVNVLDIDNQLLIGNSIMASPVMEPGQTSIKIYLPGGTSQYWYDIEDLKKYQGTGYINLSVNLDKNPGFYKGGAIIPKKDRPRRSSAVSHNDPYTFIIATDDTGSATGTLYIDDGESFEYRQKKYLYANLSYKKYQFNYSLIDDTDYETDAWIERIVILSPPLEEVSHAELTSAAMGTVKLDTLDVKNRFLIIRKPGVSVRKPFTVKLVFLKK